MLETALLINKEKGKPYDHTCRYCDKNIGDDESEGPVMINACCHIFHLDCARY